MRQVNSNEAIKIYYKADDLASGSSVSFNVWDETASQLVAGRSGSEIGTDGVYYMEQTSPSSAGYMLIIGTDGTLPKAQVIQVGNPSAKKAFYVHGYFKENQELDYDVYDANGDSIVSGQMTNIIAGFYSADVQGLTPPWFFEAHPRAKRNKVYS